MFKTRKALSIVLCLTMLIGAVSMAGAAGVPGKLIYPENGDLPAFYGEPDLMTFNDGTRVLTEADWRLRRVEVLDAIQYYEYGYVHEATVSNVTRDGNAITYTITAWAPTSATDPTMMERSQNVTVTFSFNAANPEGQRDHLPVIVGGSNSAGWASVNWPGNTGDMARTGLYFNLFPFYGPSSYDPSINKPYDGGVYDAPYDGKYDTGTLIARGWEVGRLMDALYIANADPQNEMFPEIDIHGIVPYGFSRGGKYAHLAAALDERVAMGFSGHGGQGGNSSLRNQYDSKKQPAGGDPGNTIFTAYELARDAGLTGYEDLTVAEIQDLLRKTTMFSSRTGGRVEQLGQNQGSYGPWYSTRFQYFNNQNASRFPIDHNYTIALLAPRPMLGAEGMWDMWNDPESAALMYECARPVWELYGCPERLSFLCSPFTAHAPAAIERRTAEALFSYVYRGVTMNELLYNADTNPDGIMREKPADMLWTAYVGNSGYIPMGFNLSAFKVTDPTAITFAYPGQYTLHTNGTYNGKVYNTRNFIEGLKAVIPVTSTAPTVALYNPDGVLIQTQNTDSKGNAVFTIKPAQAVKGIYTFRTVGGNLAPNERKIECWTWDFAMRPENCYDESTYVYWKWPSSLQRDVRPGSFRNPYLGQEASVANYVPALANNVKVWLEGADGQVVMDYATLRAAMKAAVSTPNFVALDTNEHRMEVQRYGVMITGYNTFAAAAGGNIPVFNPATGLTENKAVAQVQKIHIEGIQFPTLFPGYTFNYTGPAPTGTLSAYFAG